MGPISKVMSLFDEWARQFDDDAAPGESPVTERARVDTDYGTLLILDVHLGALDHGAGTGTLTALIVDDEVRQIDWLYEGDYPLPVYGHNPMTPGSEPEVLQPEM